MPATDPQEPPASNAPASAPAGSPSALDTAARAAGAAALLIALAWLPLLFRRLLAADDWTLLQAPGVGWTVELSLRQGRFGGALLQAAGTALGVDPSRSAPLTGVLAILLCALSGAVLLKLWGVRPAEGAPAVLVAALPFVHPLAFEAWTFRISPLHASSAHALALGGLLLLCRGGRPRTLALGVALLTCALGIYQISLNVALVVLAIGALLSLVAAPAEGPERREALLGWLRALGGVAAASVAALLLGRLCLLAFQLEPDARNGLWDLAAPAERARLVLRTLARVLFREKQLGTSVLSALQLALAALALAALGRRFGRRPAELLSGAALLGGALLSTVGVLALVRHFEAAPRMLTGAGFFWAGALALATRAGAGLARPAWPQRAALAVAGLWTLGALGVDHRAADELARLNQRDLAVAGRALARLEADPAWPRLQRLITRGAPIDQVDLPTLAGYVAPSALAIPWSMAPLFGALAQRPLLQATDADVAEADKVCAAGAKWPAAGSTAITASGLGVVCF